MTAQELFAGLRDGNFHDGGIRCLRLMRLRDSCFAQLKDEVVSLCEHETPSDVRASSHVTNWTRPRGDVRQYSLLNASGRTSDYSADHELTSFGKWLHLNPDRPMLRLFLETFRDLINVRINVLGPGARLAAHEEHSIIRTAAGTVGACLRCHLPVLTNGGAELTLDGDVYHLEEGTVYLVNHGCVHAVLNAGTERRVHLVWDQLLTRRAYDLLFSAEEELAWGARLAAHEQVPAPIRTERMGAFVKLPPPIDRIDAERLDFCDAQ
jgi:hypothetical protein